MIAWLAIAVQLGVAALGSPSTRLANKAECIHSEGEVLARVTLADGAVATLSAGTVRVGKKRLTRCDGLPAAHPTAIAAHGDDLAIGFRDGGVWIRERGGRGAWLEGLPRSPVRGLARMGDRLWVGTGTAGLFSSDGANATPFDHRVLGRRGITALSVDAAGELHVGVDPKGHWIIAADGAARLASRAPVRCFRGQRATVVGPAEPCISPRPDRASIGALPSNHVTALVVHRERLVVGFFDRGIAERTGDEFAIARSAPRFINALLSDGDTLYAATPKGLYRKKGDEPFVRMRLGASSAHINGLHLARDGALWIATGDGLLRWKGGDISTVGVERGLPSRIVYTVTEAGDGAIWAGTAAGLVRLEGKDITVFDQAGGDLPHDWITSLIPDHDGVLVGTYDAGVSRCSRKGCARLESFARSWINPHGLARLEGDVIAAATLGDGLVVSSGNHRLAVPTLPSDDVTSIVYFDGRLWVGTRGGLAAL